MTPSGIPSESIKVPSKLVSTPSPKSISHTHPSSFPCQSKRRRFPKRPLCTDDVSPLRVSSSFTNLGTPTSHPSQSSAKPEHTSLKYYFNKTVQFSLPAESAAPIQFQKGVSPKSRYMSPAWPPSTG